MKSINKLMVKDKWASLVSYLKGIDNLYMKFILTIIAIALVAIAMELEDGIYVNDIDGGIGVNVSGSVDVSGAVDTYEQNSVNVSGAVDTYERNSLWK